MALSSVFEEAGTSIGKWELHKRLETPFSYGVLTTFATLLVLAGSAVIRWDAQAFQWASVPTLALRVVLDILLAVVVIHAIKRADRSTFGFLRTLTIPFLLVVDIVLAYRIDFIQIVGMTLVVLALFLLFINHGFSRKGAWLTVCGALLAVVTASLFKYNITHYNSPEVEQGVVFFAMLLFFIGMGFWYEKKNPFRLFRHGVCWAQAGLMGFGAVLGSLSFLYAAPSVLMTVKRAVAIFASIASGNAVFHEKKLLLKVFAGVLVVIGFVLLLF